MSQNIDMIDNLLDIPITEEDYVDFCRNKNFVAIESVSKKLLQLESQLTTTESANLIIANGYSDLSLRLYKKKQALALRAFSDVIRNFGGKLIFLGFILENSKYVQGAIIPIREDGVILVYLSAFPSSSKVLFSASLQPRRVIDFLVEFVKVWKDEMENYAKIKSSL
jgi:hypothetical protein